MNLANPMALLWGLLVVPIVIFYILKIRLKRVPVSTVIFWRQIFDEKKPRSLWQKLRHLNKINVAMQRGRTTFRGGYEFAWSKVAPDGKTTVVHSGENSQVLSLAVDSRGETINAGTGPAAQVVRTIGPSHARARSLTYSPSSRQVLCQFPSRATDSPSRSP